MVQTLKITRLDMPEILKAALELPRAGCLETSMSYTYLKISDAYIHELFPLIPNKQIKKPDYFGKYSMGAHITVIYPEENTIINPKDVGQKHDFKVTDVFSAVINAKKYYVMKVEAPTLLEVRRKYALPDKLNFKNHWIDFHITFAVSDTPSHSL